MPYYLSLIIYLLFTIYLFIYYLFALLFIVFIISWFSLNKFIHHVLNCERGNSVLWMEHQFASCGNSCRVFGELMLKLTRKHQHCFSWSDAKCFQLSVKLLSHPFLCNSQLYKKLYLLYTLYTFEREKNCYSCTKSGHEERSYIRLLTCSALVHVSLEALTSFSVPARYENHVLSRDFVKWRGEFPLRNCSLYSCEKIAKCKKTKAVARARARTQVMPQESSQTEG